MLIVWVGVSILFIFAVWFSLFFADVYISELRVSFLPYRVYGGIGLGAAGIYFFFQVISQTKKLYTLLLTCCCFLVGGWYMIEWESFYEQYVFEYREQTGLRFFYANIRHDNDAMDELLDNIIAEDPDIIFLVEYTPDHHKKLYPQLRDAYPHINTEYPENGPAGKVIYAKHPFNNLAPTLEGSATWKYGYISMERGSNEYIFYLVHTSAPISPRFLTMRNMQLQTLVQDITAHQDADHYESIVTILGDFNITPWSPAYKNLALEWESFENMSRYLSKTFTRWLPGSYIGAHIDHVRTNTPEAMKYIDVLPLQGSDHQAIVGSIHYDE